MLLPSIHLPWPSPSLCLTVCPQQLTPKNIFSFKIPSVSPHARTLCYLCHTSKDVTNVAVPVGLLDQFQIPWLLSLRHASKRLVGDIVFPSHFLIFPNVSIPQEKILYAKTLTDTGVPQKCSCTKNHPMGIPMYSEYTGLKSKFALC
jgi:hypothetical protein